MPGIRRAGSCKPYNSWREHVVRHIQEDLLKFQARNGLGEASKSPGGSRHVLCSCQCSATF